MRSRRATYAIAGKAVFGVVLIVVILFMPHGVLGRWRSRATQRGAKRRRAASRSAESAVATPPARSRAGRRPARARRMLAKSFGACTRCAASRSTCAKAKCSACSDRTARASRRSSTSSAVTTGPTRAGSRSAAARSRPARAPDRARRHRAHLPDPAAVRELTVLDNVALAGDVRRRDADARGGRARGRALARVHAASRARADAPPDELNLHQRKFLELARALALRPAARAARRGAVGPDARRDRRRGRARSARSARQGATIVLVEHVMRAVTGARRPHRRAQSRRGDRRRRRRREVMRRAGGRDRVSRGAGPCLSASASRSRYGAGARAADVSLSVAARRARLRRRRRTAPARPRSSTRSPGSIRSGRAALAFDGVDLARLPPHRFSAAGHRHRAGRPAPLHADDGAREPRAGQPRPGSAARAARVARRASASSSRRWPRGSTRRPARSRAASSRWSRSRAR